ncbi:hypothetical protein CesoFtcFv8_008308 [Champsocephalus esox]|uniref:Uncharacterized protein n=1 Tax=Champsocephalus esox TaxID=159716 RepID=A0AAN8H1T5_9TELE|nr:hypothetical protein CesoFtcFv8_008308 [Champsocephalus esox]
MYLCSRSSTGGETNSPELSVFVSFCSSDSSRAAGVQTDLLPSSARLDPENTIYSSGLEGFASFIHLQHNGYT